MIAGTAPHLIAELEFASMTAIDAALSSAEGQAAGADLANFAQAGVTIMIDEAREA